MSAADVGSSVLELVVASISTIEIIWPYLLTASYANAVWRRADVKNTRNYCELLGVDNYPYWEYWFGSFRCSHMRSMRLPLNNEFICHCRQMKSMNKITALQTLFLTLYRREQRLFFLSFFLDTRSKDSFWTAGRMCLSRVYGWFFEGEGFYGANSTEISSKCKIWSPNSSAFSNSEKTNSTWIVVLHCLTHHLYISFFYPFQMYLIFNLKFCTFVKHHTCNIWYIFMIFCNFYTWLMWSPHSLHQICR